MRGTMREFGLARNLWLRWLVRALLLLLLMLLRPRCDTFHAELLGGYTPDLWVDLCVGLFLQ